MPDNSPNLVLGVDPGLSGALALYSPLEKKLIAYKDMPTSKSTTGKKLIDVYDLAFWIGIHVPKIKFAVVEDVGAMTYVDAKGQVRGQGAASSFSFGQTKGQVQGVLAAYMVPMLLIKPAVWKCAMDLDSDKKRSCQKARKLFPDWSMAFMRLKDADRAEAALMAVYGAKHDSSFSVSTNRGRVVS